MNTLPDDGLSCEETELIAFPFVVPHRTVRSRATALRIRLCYVLKRAGQLLGLEVQRHARPLGREARPFYGLRRLVVR